MGTSIHDVVGAETVARLRDTIGDRTDAVVAVATTDCRMVWASDAGSAEMFGRSQADFEGHSQYDYIHPEDQTTFRRKMAAALRGETVRYAVRAMGADGSWVRVVSVAWLVQTPEEPLIVSIAVPGHAD